MRAFRRRSLLSISLLWWLSVLSVSAQHSFVGQALPTDSVTSFTSEMSFRGNGLSGVCVAKGTTVGAKGSLMNEFGIKALDFIYDAERGKVKVLNVMTFLNKWYIKRVMRQDLLILFRCNEQSVGKKHQLTKTSDGSVELTNKKYNIAYSLTPIISNGSDIEPET